MYGSYLGTLFQLTNVWQCVATGVYISCYVSLFLLQCTGSGNEFMYVFRQLH